MDVLASGRLRQLMRRDETFRRPRLGDVNEPGDTFFMVVTKSSATIFVLNWIHRVMCTASHTHRQGHTLTALTIRERVIQQPFLGPTILFPEVPDIADDF